MTDPSNTGRRIGAGGWIAIGFGVLSLGVMVAGIIWLVMAARDATATAREFFEHAFAGRSAEAYALTSPDFQGRMTEMALEAYFDGLAPLTTIRFRSIETVGNDRTRTTWAEGSGTTEDGCPSAITVEIRNDRIQSFDLDPICPAEDSAT